MVGAVRDATVVVALDFGTTFSGFAYAHKGSPDNVYKFYEWPDSSEGCGKPYCKTETSLYYVQPEDGSSETYELKAWGWSALAHHSEAVQKAARAHRQRELSQERSEGAAYNVDFYITRFKLHLAGEENVRKSRMATRPVSAEALPPGLTVDRCVEDYLSKISAFALDHLRGRFGDQLTMKDVQWCLTVPAIWDDSAKQRMKICAEKAGMVAGAYTPKDAEASPHPLLPILEPEAASFYCWNKAEHLNLRLYDHFIVADVGGGTTDIVVHSRANGDSQLRIREVQVSSGALCGGTHVDSNFFRFLGREIGCLKDFVYENAFVWLNLQSRWEAIKRTFDGEGDSKLYLPASLSSA